MSCRLHSLCASLSIHELSDVLGSFTSDMGFVITAPPSHESILPLVRVVVRLGEWVFSGVLRMAGEVPRTKITGAPQHSCG
jgi:hypothetical protein